MPEEARATLYVLHDYSIGELADIDDICGKVGARFFIAKAHQGPDQLLVYDCPVTWGLSPVVGRSEGLQDSQISGTLVKHGATYILEWGELICIHS